MARLCARGDASNPDFFARADGISKNKADFVVKHTHRHRARRHFVHRRDSRTLVVGRSRGARELFVAHSCVPAIKEFLIACGLDKFLRRYIMMASAAA